MDRKEPVPYYGGVRIIEIEIIRILVSLRPDKVSVQRGILITNNFQCFCSFSKVHIQLRPISNDLANYLHGTPGHVIRQSYLRPNHLQKLLNNRNRHRGLKVCQPGSLLSQFQLPWQSCSFLCFYCTAGIIAIQAHLNPVKTARTRCENQEWSPLDNKMPGYIINQRFSCTSLLRNRQLLRAQCLFSFQLLALKGTINVAFGFMDFLDAFQDSEASVVSGKKKHTQINFKCRAPTGIHISGQDTENQLCLLERTKFTEGTGAC